MKNLEEIWYFKKLNGRMKKGNVSFVPGEFKIFDEIVVNAIDRYTRTYESTNLKTIRVRNIRVDLIEKVVKLVCSMMEMVFH